MYGNLNQHLGESQPNSMYGNFQGFLQKASRWFVNDSTMAILYGKNTRGRFFGFCQPRNKQI